MRYYATVEGGQGNLLSANAAEDIKQKVMANLRRFRVLSGFDYEGISLSGVDVTAVPPPDLGAIQRRLDLHPGRLASTRLVVSPQVLTDGSGPLGFELVIAVCEGDRFAWHPGGDNFAGVITIDRTNRLSKATATVADIFQDIMIGNDASIQAVLSKFAAAGGSRADFYRMKAAFAVDAVTTGVLPGLHAVFAPNAYASFSAIARRELYAWLSETELLRISELWRSFMVSQMRDHFLDCEQAVHLVRRGYFHGLNAERIGGEGPNAQARSQRQYLPEKDLEAVFLDRRIVMQDDSYVLCIINRPNGPNKDELSVEFGRDSKEALKRIKLCTETEFKRMIDFTRRGLVTPIRLYLKEPPRSV